MKLVIFGATGTAGLQLVKQALQQQYNVTAYGRNIHLLIELQEQHPNLKLVKAGLFDTGEINDALKGANGVLSAIGGDLQEGDDTRSLGIKYITQGMLKQKVNNIIAIGGIGCLQATPELMVYETESFPEEYKAVTREHLKALSYLQQSNVNYTFVCPPTITTKEATGEYEIKTDYPTSKFSITASDLAAYMLKQVLVTTTTKYKVGISNN